MPDRMPEWMPDRMPHGMSKKNDRKPERMSDRMSEYIMPEYSIYIYQIYFQTVCQKPCQKCQNICQGEDHSKKICLLLLLACCKLNRKGWVRMETNHIARFVGKDQALRVCVCVHYETYIIYILYIYIVICIYTNHTHSAPHTYISIIHTTVVCYLLQYTVQVL